MNGINGIIHTKLGAEQTQVHSLPIEERNALKRALTIKFLILMLLSNLGVYFLASGPSVSSNSPLAKTQLLRHQGYILVVLPIKNYVPFVEHAKEYPAHLVFSEENEISIASVFLHPDQSAIQNKEDNSALGPLNQTEETPTFMLVEILEKDLPLIISKKGKVLSAYPKTSFPLNRQKKESIKGEIHEIFL